MFVLLVRTGRGIMEMMMQLPYLGARAVMRIFHFVHTVDIAMVLAMRSTDS